MEAKLWIALLVLLFPAWSAAENPKDTLDVTGTGEVVVPADVVVLPIVLTTQNGNVQRAKELNDAIASQILALAVRRRVSRPVLAHTALTFDLEQRPRVLQKTASDLPPSLNQGVENQENDLFTPDKTNREVQQESGYPQQGKSYPRRAAGGGGHEPAIQVTRQMEARFEGLEPLIGFAAEVAKWEAAKSGALRLSSPQFTVANLRPHLAEARRRAVAAAAEKARLLAECNGVRLGPATQIFDTNQGVAERGCPRPSEDPFGAAPAFPYPSSGPEAVIAVPLAPGIGLAPGASAGSTDLTQTAAGVVSITAAVRIVFDIGRPQ